MVDAEFAKTVRAEEVRSLARDGFLDSVSVGFTDPVRENKGGTTWVTKARLRELSVVVFPANEEAQILAVRSMSERHSMKLMAVKAQIMALEADLAALPRVTRGADPALADAYDMLRDLTAFLADLGKKG
jgi:phage head maturation protease